MPETLADIADDFRNLTTGNHDDIPQPLGSWSFDDMMNLLNISYGLFKGTHVLASEKAGSARTEAGKLIATYMLSDQFQALTAATRIRPMHHCPGAEKTLLKTISNERVDNPANKSPIIVVSDDEPIGVIKPAGYRYVYGLRNDFKNNILARSFSAPLEIYARTDFPPEADHAWYMQAEQIRTNVPLRLSCLAIAVSQRPPMKGYTGDPLFDEDIWGQAVGTSTHSDVQIQVDQLFRHAKPLTLNRFITD